jgi:hypothetical protein
MVDMDKVDAILRTIDALNDEERKTLLNGLHDDITKWLDRLGWMITIQPQYAGGCERYWFIDGPSDDCPAWCDNGRLARHTYTPPDPRAW